MTLRRRLARPGARPRVGRPARSRPTTCSCVRPLGGTDDEIAGILTAARAGRAGHVRPARSRRDLGDYRSGRLLRDALRLGFRSSAGPFRSFGRIAVEPRPYQLVPLLMALQARPGPAADRRRRRHRQDDRGAADRPRAARPRRRSAARRALPAAPRRAVAGRAARQVPHRRRARPAVAPPRGSSAACGVGESLFERVPVTSSSTDFIKSDRRRDDFLRACPELVIVDEAHTCADAGAGRAAATSATSSSRASPPTPNRHLILVTATPHRATRTPSARCSASSTRPSRDLPDDLSGDERRAERASGSPGTSSSAAAATSRTTSTRHAVPRARASARRPTSSRPSTERSSTTVLAYARETVARPGAAAPTASASAGGRRSALLRSLGSSPAAAAATLREPRRTAGRRRRSRRPTSSAAAPSST